MCRILTSCCCVVAWINIVVWSWNKNIAFCEVLSLCCETFWIWCTTILVVICDDQLLNLFNRLSSCQRTVPAIFELFQSMYLYTSYANRHCITRFYAFCLSTATQTNKTFCLLLAKKKTHNFLWIAIRIQNKSITLKTINTSVSVRPIEFHQHRSISFYSKYQSNQQPTTLNYLNSQLIFRKKL